jgi:hypothetical protein
MAGHQEVHRVLSRCVGEAAMSSHRVLGLWKMHGRFTKESPS